MAPVSAPLPTPRNLPFQCTASGIHSSIAISESAVGASVAVTLQNANGADTTIVADPLLAVVVNGAVMSVADVIVPPARENPRRLVHDVAAPIGGPDANQAADTMMENEAAAAILFHGRMGFLLLPANRQPAV